MQGWSLRLQTYKFELCFKSGKNNPADYLSRHVSDSIEQSSHAQRLAESIINYVLSTSAPKPVPIDVIRQHTTQDATLQAVMKVFTLVISTYTEINPVLTGRYLANVLCQDKNCLHPRLQYAIERHSYHNSKFITRKCC